MKEKEYLIQSLPGMGGDWVREMYEEAKGERMKVKAWKCEKIPEKEFDKYPYLYDGWREDFRKDGYVYIIYDPQHPQDQARSDG